MGDTGKVTRNKGVTSGAKGTEALTIGHYYLNHYQSLRRVEEHVDKPVVDDDEEWVNPFWGMTEEVDGENDAEKDEVSKETYAWIYEILAKHINGIINGDTNEADDLSQGEDEDEQSNQCKHCGVDMVIESELKKHVLLRHPEEAPEEEAEEKTDDLKEDEDEEVEKKEKEVEKEREEDVRSPASEEKADRVSPRVSPSKETCNDCKRFFLKRKTFESHKINGHCRPDWVCNPCDRSFASNQRLQYHQGVVHKDVVKAVPNIKPIEEVVSKRSTEEVDDNRAVKRAKGDAPLAVENQSCEKLVEKPKNKVNWPHPDHKRRLVEQRRRTVAEVKKVEKCKKKADNEALEVVVQWSY